MAEPYDATNRAGKRKPLQACDVLVPGGSALASAAARAVRLTLLRGEGECGGAAGLPIDGVRCQMDAAVRASVGSGAADYREGDARCEVGEVLGAGKHDVVVA